MNSSGVAVNTLGCFVRFKKICHRVDESRWREVSMESRAKLFGHPVHPMLIVFPLGLFITSLIFDFISMGSGNGTWSIVAYYMIGGGIVGGLAAAVFGLI